MKLCFPIPVLLLVSLLALAAAPVPPASQPAAKPTVYLIGDSTVNNNANGGLGWGTPFAKLFDPAKATVVNRAIAGRSARSFYSEGRWDGRNGVKDALKPGDFLFIQFGTNDGGDPHGPNTKGRPDLPGTGDETTTAPGSAGQEETVHTFGWYLTKFVEDTKAKGATPIMLNLVPHNRWTGDKIQRNEVNSFVKWSADVAAKENIPYIDLNAISAGRLEKEGPSIVPAKYFTPPGDNTHTNPAGAQLNAESVLMGIRALKDLKLNDCLSDAGKKLDPADVKDVQSANAATAASQAAKP